MHSVIRPDSQHPWPPTRTSFHPSVPAGHTQGARRSASLRIVSLAVAVAATFVTVASAQDDDDDPLLIEIDVQILAPSQASAKPPTDVPPAAPVQAAGPAAEEKRLQELLKLKFDRRAQTVLQALAKKAEGVAAATNEVEQFQNAVSLGDWPAMKEFLARLPTNQVAQVYNYLLRELQKPPAPTSPPGQPPSPQPPGAPQPAHVLRPDDVLALSEVVPGELTEEQVELLGQLLGRALSKGHTIEPILAKLEEGTARFGGSDPNKRALAAKLLMAANRLTDAGKFLPALDHVLRQNDFKALNVHATYLMALGSDKQQPSASLSLRKAWELTQTVLGTTNAPTKEREQALNRALDLLPLLAREVGTNWLRETFHKHPEQGMNIIATVGGLVAQNFTSRDLELRRKHLELQRRVVDSLLAALGQETKPWEPTLNLLALGWLQEAEHSKSRYNPPRPRSYPQYDMFGNRIYFEEPDMSPRFQDPNQVPPVPVDQVLPTAPNESWLARLDPTLVPRIRMLLAELHLKMEDEQKALPYIESLAADYPKAALSLAHDCLRAWARSHDPNQQSSQMYRRVYYGPYGMVQQSGVPLTRAMQVRNLQELGGLLARLRKMPIGDLDQPTVVSAFTSAHSQAEVFRVEDIEQVFGPLDSLQPQVLSELLQTMRQRLAGQWRAPRVQQEAQTKRTDKQIDAEVVRGYELVLKLIQKALDRQPDNWRLNLVHGAALFDWAEYDYGKKVDLAIYTDKRDRAFKSFERAADLYAALVPSLEEKDQTPLVYQQWFNATLGASDLAYLTRQSEPNTNHLTKIRKAILSLPDEAAERHLAGFGRGLSESAQQLKPELKPRYLRAGVSITGDHESAAEARKLVTYYDDLLQEIALEVRVDGDAAVGHTRPFGVFVAIRHTEALGRESGGFGRYLQNQQNVGYYYNPYGGGPVNYRDDFEKQVREKVGEGFEVLSVTFHDDKVQPRGFGRPGWRETPYAYLLLKAKDAAVDRIPPLQLDIDFYDRRGQVVLPVVSLTQLIDARPDTLPARPLRKVEVLQILDDRDLAKGTLGLEIKATGRGLLPELKELLDVTLAGFKLDKMDDRGLAVVRMDAEGDEVAPVSERNWLITFRVAEGAEASATFHFPKARLPGLELTYKRYADADLVEVKPELALAGVPLRPRSPWKWIALATVFVVLLGAAWLVLRKKVTGVTQEQPAAYAVPAHVTAFNVLTLLRRMSEDTRLALNAEQRRELAATIVALQKRFFDRPTAGNHEPDLEDVAKRWVRAVS